jgi:hypothetical protein
MNLKMKNIIVAKIEISMRSFIRKLRAMNSKKSYSFVSIQLLSASRLFNAARTVVKNIPIL